MSKIERISVPVPAGFQQGKIVALTAKVCEKMGEGWAFESLLLDDGKVTFTRETAMLEVHEGEKSAKKLRLPSGTKPSDGDKIAARMEDANPGYVLVRFDPHLGEAIMSKMTDDELRCRGSVAVALAVKPWEVLVRERSDGGFDIVLPRTYVASRHDAKLPVDQLRRIARMCKDPDLTLQLLRIAAPTAGDIVAVLNELGGNYVNLTTTTST